MGTVVSTEGADAPVPASTASSPASTRRSIAVATRRSLVMRWSWPSISRSVSSPTHTSGTSAARG